MYISFWAELFLSTYTKLKFCERWHFCLYIKTGHSINWSFIGKTPEHELMILSLDASEVEHKVVPVCSITETATHQSMVMRKSNNAVQWKTLCSKRYSRCGCSVPSNHDSPLWILCQVSTENKHGSLNWCVCTSCMCVCVLEVVAVGLRVGALSWLPGNRKKKTIDETIPVESVSFHH